MIRKLSHVKEIVLKEVYEYDTISKAFEHCRLMELEEWELISGIEYIDNFPFVYKATYSKVVNNYEG